MMFPNAAATAVMDNAMPSIHTRHRPLRRWLASLVFAAIVAVPTGSVFAQVVVIANGSPITAYDIEQRTKLLMSSGNKQKPDRQEVIKELIDDRLKIAKARTYGLAVSDAEVDEAYNSMATRQHITPAQFAQLLGRSGIAPETIKARIRADLTWGQLVRGKFSSTLEIGESEITKALRERKDPEADPVGYIYSLTPVMVLVPQGSAENILDSKRREAENLRGRFLTCKDGLAFARALRDVAVREPVSRSSADLPPPLRELLAKMEVGRLTTPEVTPQGLQMFALCEKKESKSDTPGKREMRQQLFAKQFEVEAKKYLDEIRKQAMIEYK
jgi:peptidyl-prolyl cis-trans isomerase SurA